MKRKMVKRMALAVAGMAAISLTACGGTKGVSSAKGEEPIPASEAFGQEGVWFYSDSAAAKDEKVDSVMIFDGKGNVTTYKTDITYSDLQGLSEKEIVELAKEQDQTGNNTASETLVYSCRSGLNADVSEADGDSWQPYREAEEEIELYPGLGVQEVYDMRFQGFGTLVLMTGEDHPGFSLDTPDARGVEVD